MKYAALIIALLLAPLASAQTVYLWSASTGEWVPMQCGGCCGGGNCGGWCPQGGCQGGICYPQQRPQPQQPAPEQDPGEIAGPLPQYEVRPQQPVPQQPAPELKPVPPANPPMPPAPTIDPNALKDQQAAIIKEIHDSQSSIEKSLVVIRDKGGCQCDNSKLATADQMHELIAAIKESNTTYIAVLNELKNAKQPVPANVASGTPVFYDIRPHKE